MQETTHTYTITASLHALAARYRALAVEADLRALMAIRTDPEKIERTEEAFRALIVLQARHLKQGMVEDTPGNDPQGSTTMEAHA